MTGIHSKPTVLHAVNYDGDKRLLNVELHPGEVYQYFDVPPDVYQQLILSEAREQYFDRQIRLKYRHRRLLQI